VTIDDSPICCEAPRQALERPQDATWPVQGCDKGPGRKSRQRLRPEASATNREEPRDVVSGSDAGGRYPGAGHRNRVASKGMKRITPVDCYGYAQ
jgi:hypothetical protein